MGNMREEVEMVRRIAGTVLPGDVVDTLAAAICDCAYKAYEQGLREGYYEGHEEGYDEGYADGQLDSEVDV